MGAGMLFGLLHSTLTVPFGLSQHVVGLGITLLATAAPISPIAWRCRASPPRRGSSRSSRWPIPYLSDLPILGPALFTQTPLTYLAFALVGVVSLGPLPHAAGLALRAAGENPAAVEAQGLSVTGLRMGAVMVGSGLMAVGGAFLTMSAFNSFFFEMVNGRGWVCIALVVFGAWMPGKALLGAVLFAIFDALQIRLQQTPLGAAGALSGVPDDAVPAVDPGAGGDVAPRRRAGGADGALQQGGTLMFDLIVKGGTLPDGTVADIGIRGETIAAIERAGGRRGGRGDRRHRRSGQPALRRSAFPHGRDAQLRHSRGSTPRGTLLEGIALWGELKQVATVDQMVGARWPIATGRYQHGPAGDPQPCRHLPDALNTVEALLDVREAVKGYIDLQLGRLSRRTDSTAPDGAREH
jgi:hypothetical protein